MAKTKNTTPSRLASALEAINNLTMRGLSNILSGGYAAARAAHTEIVVRPVIQKCNAFYNHFLPLVSELVALFIENYRRYFKLALAYPHQAGSDPDEWAWNQLQPALYTTFEWIRDWYILACDGENRYVQHVGSTEFVPGQTASLSIPLTISPAPPPESWRAPAWLFQIGPVVGVGPLKEHHVPATDSEEKLSAAHTRLLLKGTRRVFLMALGTTIETVRNEETAAAGAILAETTDSQEARRSDKRKGSKRPLKGVEGLGPKQADLSQYTHKLTEKQQLAFSLKYEYGLGPAEIASRMELDRKTVYEHLAAAERKIDQVRSTEKRKGNRAKGTPE